MKATEGPILGTMHKVNHLVDDCATVIVYIDDDEHLKLQVSLLSIKHDKLRYY